MRKCPSLNPSLDLSLLIFIFEYITVHLRRSIFLYPEFFHRLTFLVCVSVTTSFRSVKALVRARLPVKRLRKFLLLDLHPKRALQTVAILRPTIELLFRLLL